MKTITIFLITLSFSFFTNHLIAQNPSSSTLNLSASLLPFFLFSLLTLASLYLFILFIIKSKMKAQWIYIISVVAMLSGLYLTFQLQNIEEKQMPINSQDNNINLDTNQPKSTNVIHSEFYVVNMANIIILLTTIVIDWRRKHTYKPS